MEKCYLNLALRSISYTPPDELKSLILEQLKMEILIAALVTDRKKLEAAVSERKKVVIAEKKELKSIHKNQKKDRYPCKVHRDIAATLDLLTSKLWLNCKRVEQMKHFEDFVHMLEDDIERIHQIAAKIESRVNCIKKTYASTCTLKNKSGVEQAQCQGKSKGIKIKKLKKRKNGEAWAAKAKVESDYSQMESL